MGVITTKILLIRHVIRLATSLSSGLGLGYDVITGSRSYRGQGHNHEDVVVKQLMTSRQRQHVYVL